MNEDTSDWYMHRLEEFLPGARGAAKPNHRTVRRQRRAVAQAKANAKPGTAVEGSGRC